MQTTRSYDHPKPVVKALGHGDAMVIRVQLDDKTALTMGVGEARELAEAMLVAIDRPDPRRGGGEKCASCEKPATTIKAGRAYCDEHARGARP